jgi:hypothetical protein
MNRISLLDTQASTEGAENEDRPSRWIKFPPSPINLSLIPITWNGTHIYISRDLGRYYLERFVFWEPTAGSNSTLTRSSTPPPLSKDKKEGKKEQKDVEWNIGSEYFSNIDGQI